MYIVLNQRTRDRRFRVAILAAEEVEYAQVMRGHLAYGRRTQSCLCYEFVPSGVDEFVVFGEDLEPLPESGAVQVFNESLPCKAGEIWSAVACRAGGIVVDRADGEYVSYHAVTSHGTLVEVPEALLLRLDYIEGEPVASAYPEPPAEELQQTLTAAGYLE